MVGRWWDGRSTHIAETGERSKRAHTQHSYMAAGKGKDAEGGRETITSYPSLQSLHRCPEAPEKKHHASSSSPLRGLHTANIRDEAAWRYTVYV